MKISVDFVTSSNLLSPFSIFNRILFEDENEKKDRMVCNMRFIVNMCLNCKLFRFFTLLAIPPAELSAFNISLNEY